MAQQVEEELFVELERAGKLLQDLPRAVEEEEEGRRQFGVAGRRAAAAQRRAPVAPHERVPRLDPLALHQRLEAVHRPAVGLQDHLEHTKQRHTPNKSSIVYADTTKISSRLPEHQLYPFRHSTFLRLMIHIWKQLYRKALQQNQTQPNLTLSNLT